MAKNFPYFKFLVTEWMTGDIVFESFEIQGYFINICALYWHRNGVLTEEDLDKRYKRDDLFKIIKDKFLTINDGFLCIKFLDEQMKEISEISEKNSKNGRLGGRPKVSLNIEKKPTANRPLTDRKAKKSKEEEEEDKDKEEDKEINKKENIIKEKKFVFVKPTISECKDYFLQNGYKEDAGEKFYNYYSVANWKDGKGNKVKNWKQKAQAVWFKDENKIEVKRLLGQTSSGMVW